MLSNNLKIVNLYCNDDIKVLLQNETLMRKYKYSFGNNFYHKLLYMIDFIYKRPFLNKGEENDGWVFSSSKKHQEIYTSHDAKDLISVLKEIGVIVVNDSYIVGSVTKSYKLVRAFRKGFKLKKFFCKDSKFLSKIYNERMKIYNNYHDYEKIMNDNLFNLEIKGDLARKHNLKLLIDNFNDNDNVIYYEKKYKTIISLKSRTPKKQKSTKPLKLKRFTVWEYNQLVDEFLLILNENKVPKKSVKPLTHIERKTLTRNDIYLARKIKSLIDTYHQSCYAIQAIENIKTNKEIRFKICSFGRIHTNLTSLKSELRQYLLFNGEKLEAYDIRNSQPLFYALLLRDFYKGKNMPDDVKTYIEQCRTGKFYDYLMDIKNLSQEKRGSYKPLLFGQVFYGKIPKSIYGEAILFKREFPTVWGHICKDKSGIGDEAYKELSRAMQMKESSIMIQKVAKECVRRNIPILSLHDSLPSSPKHSNEIKGIIVNIFKNEYQIEPTLKVA